MFRVDICTIVYTILKVHLTNEIISIAFYFSFSSTNISECELLMIIFGVACRFLNRTAAHPVLLSDPDFREFIEKDSELPKATSTSALSGAGVMRLFHKVGESIEKMAFKMDENDEVRNTLVSSVFSV
jgi:hypothetical protein